MDPTEQAAQNFEQSLKRLESVVNQLESAETGLDRPLELYEQAVGLLNQCRSILDAAEQRIRLLTGVDAQGNPITEPVQATGTADQPAEPSPSPGPGSRRKPVQPHKGDQLF